MASAHSEGTENYSVLIVFGLLMLCSCTLCFQFGFPYNAVFLQVLHKPVVDLQTSAEKLLDDCVRYMEKISGLYGAEDDASMAVTEAKSPPPQTLIDDAYNVAMCLKGVLVQYNGVVKARHHSGKR